MVRPNQITEVHGDQITFIMFARNKKQVKRRVLYLNFPKTIARTVLGGESVDDYITNVKTLSEGFVNRYLVTINTGRL